MTPPGRRHFPRAIRIGAASLSIAALSACGATPTYGGWFDDDRTTAIAAESTALTVRWTRQITDDGPYIAVEYSSAGLDPRHDRVYVGSSDGKFLAFDGHGAKMWDYDPESGVESAPAVDSGRGELFLASEDGVVHALDWRLGEKRWSKASGGPVRQTPEISEDAIFVVREDDAVVALSREDGEVLWTYQREVDVEFAITGHAGILLADGMLYTGFTDGAVVALQATTGSLKWERLTQLDAAEREGEAIRFYDVDATPVLSDGVLYTASVSAGVYALSLEGGSVLWRDARLTEVTGMAAVGRHLILASATQGIMAFDLRLKRSVWSKPLERGAPTQPTLAGTTSSAAADAHYVLVGESRGALMAIDLRTGREVARIEHGQGFSAPPSVAGPLGWAMTNGGKLIAFRL